MKKCRGDEIVRELPARVQFHGFHLSKGEADETLGRGSAVQEVQVLVACS